MINLTSSTTSQVPNLGASYDSLLQEETDKSVTDETTPEQTIHSSYTQATNPSKTLVASSARHGNRPRDMMVAQRVIVTSSKNKRTKPSRISHKEEIG